MCVLTHDNCGEVEEIVEFADRFNVYVVFQRHHAKKTGDAASDAGIDKQLVGRLMKLRRRRGNLLCSKEYLQGIGGFGTGDGRQLCNAGQRYFSIDPYGYLHPCVDLPATGHLLKDDIATVRSPDAKQTVNSCNGCWYSFRGESDTASSLSGYCGQLLLGLKVLARNEWRRLVPSRLIRRC